jgi:hypothetical protein
VLLGAHTGTKYLKCVARPQSARRAPAERPQSARRSVTWGPRPHTAWAQNIYNVLPGRRDPAWLPGPCLYTGWGCARGSHICLRCPCFTDPDQAVGTESARRSAAERPQSACRSAAERPRSARRAPAERPQSARRVPAERPQSARRAPAERPQSACRAPIERPQLQIITLTVVVGFKSAVAFGTMWIVAEPGESLLPSASEDEAVRAPCQHCLVVGAGTPVHAQVVEVAEPFMW